MRWGKLKPKVISIYLSKVGKKKSTPRAKVRKEHSGVVF